VAIETITASRADLSYTFKTPGTFYVTITGSDNCSKNESPKTRVDVYPLPLPLFDADLKSGCKSITVNFTNQTADVPLAPASSLSYVWDFGDGTQVAGFNPPAHQYNAAGSPYNVTLTATNPATGCINVLVKSAFIVVNTQPATEFAARPDSINIIPNYQFQFVDQTTGSPVTWSWAFGDGTTSSTQNSNHTYADTGIYKVTLTTINSAGCDSTITHNVRITGTPGQLFLPNAFEPDGLYPELRTFMAKGSGILTWHMAIYNNYSQLIWETTKLNDQGQPVDGWDGRIKGKPAPQGVYVWQITAKFINGTKWEGNVIENSSPKRVGVVHLIR
jgi:PKD repeat protein